MENYAHILQTLEKACLDFQVEISFAPDLKFCLFKSKKYDYC
jgi:hypothetical protein